MRFEKQDVLELEHCYAVKCMDIGGRAWAVFATEGVGPACGVDVETLAVTRLWEEPGGTMCMVPVPGRADGSFWAVQKFYLGFHSAQARIVCCRPAPSGGWQTLTLFDLPYVHRFDLLKNGERLDFVAGVLCRSKQYAEDWSDPGYIAVGSVDPASPGAPARLRVIQDGLTKNHGYSKFVSGGVERGLFAAEEGVFLVTPPAGGRPDWQVERIFTRPASEARLFDIDGDGQNELITIEPFHGPSFRIYRSGPAGYTPLYECPLALDFCHVIWTGALRGRPCVIGACRGGPGSLFLLTWEGDGLALTEIDRGVGPSNVDVIHGPDFDLIASANREAGRGALYRVYDN